MRYTSPCAAKEIFSVIVSFEVLQMRYAYVPSSNFTFLDESAGFSRFMHGTVSDGIPESFSSTSASSSAPIGTKTFSYSTNSPQREPSITRAVLTNSSSMISKATPARSSICPSFSYSVMAVLPISPPPDIERYGQYNAVFTSAFPLSRIYDIRAV